MDKTKGLDSLSFERNVGENWRKWLQKYNLFLRAHDKSGKSDATKVAILLTYIGDEGLYNTYTYGEQGDEMKLDKVIEKFEAYCNPHKNTVIERYNFWEVKQAEGQTIDQYITELKTRARNCEFCDQTELTIRDRIIFGVSDSELKQKLLRNSDDPSLKSVIDLCRSFEAAKIQIQATEKTAAVHAIRQKSGKKSSTSKDKTEKGKTFYCKRCGAKHQYAACPAYGKVCAKCHKKNHLTKMCFSQSDQHHTNKKQMHTLEELEETEELFVGTLNTNDSYENAWYEKVIVEKRNKSLRLCLDPKNLNLAVKREHFKIPTPDEIASQLSGKTVFSILYEKDGYWHVELDEESSFLWTFNTPFGRYRFKRMHFGLCSASKIFQKRNKETFGDIQGLQMISDDMITAGADTKEQDEILQRVMVRAQEKGVKFNKDKIQLRVCEVKYMGNIISQDGLRPDEDKVAAIVDMPTPACKQDVQRLLGTLNFLSQYIPNMLEVTAPLQSLLKKENQWIWQHEHDKALKHIKITLTSKPVLKFYNVNQSVTIQADASQFGLGACLMQDGHPIAYASRALTTAEVNYAQIEKELLVIVYSCEKFHQYVYGKIIDVQSDHKPLKTILRKPFSKAAPRLQRMIMRLQRYQLSVKYVPSKLMYLADTLSRAFLPISASTEQDIHDDANVMIHTLKESLPVSSEKLQELQEATRQDPVMQELYKLIKTGWPASKKKAPQSVLPYWQLRDEIHEIDGLIMIGEKLVIPTNYRPEILKAIHQGHQGIEKCKAKGSSCSLLAWHGITD